MASLEIRGPHGTDKIRDRQRGAMPRERERERGEEREAEIEGKKEMEGGRQR